MRRQTLSLFLILLILISAGGVISIVDAASHVTLGQVSKPTSPPTSVSIVLPSSSSTQLSSTALTAMASDTSVVVGYEITIYGKLTFHALPVPQQPIILYRSTDNATDNARWTAVNTTMTTNNGTYAFAQTEHEQGTYYYRTAFAGGYPYDPAVSEALTVHFGLLL